MHFWIGFNIVIFNFLIVGFRTNIVSQRFLEVKIIKIPLLLVGALIALMDRKGKQCKSMVKSVHKGRWLHLLVNS